jgi:hypothetical protein
MGRDGVRERGRRPKTTCGWVGLSRLWTEARGRYGRRERCKHTASRRCLRSNA